MICEDVIHFGNGIDMLVPIEKDLNKMSILGQCKEILVIC